MLLLSALPSAFALASALRRFTSASTSEAFFSSPEAIRSSIAARMAGPVDGRREGRALRRQIPNGSGFVGVVLRYPHEIESRVVAHVELSGEPRQELHVSEDRLHPFKRQADLDDILGGDSYDIKRSARE